MDDREFFDQLYAAWAKTTSDTEFWISKVDEDLGIPTVEIWDVDKRVGSFPVRSEVIGDFIATIHGCLPDLVRRLNDALDEAERLDVEKDELHGRIAELELEVVKLEENVQFGPEGGPV